MVTADVGLLNAEFYVNAQDPALDFILTNLLSIIFLFKIHCGTKMAVGIGSLY